MTMVIFLIALAHGLPILVVRFVTNSRSALTIAAVVMSLVAILIGGIAYAVFDLLAIGVVYYVCISSIAPSKTARAEAAAPQPQVLHVEQKKSSDAASLIIGFVAVALLFVYYFIFPDKPTQSTPSVHDRLEASVPSLAKENSGTKFPLLDARVDGISLYVWFRSTEKTAVDVIAQFANTNLIWGYSAGYCSSPTYGPLLNEGAKIFVNLSGKDAKPVGTYTVSKSDCDAYERTVSYRK